MSAALNVLVVDDHPVNRLVLAEMLKLLGCDVALAETGAQALEVIGGQDFDLVFLDRHMPGMSGDDLIQRLPDDQFVVAWSTDLSDLPQRYNGVLSKPASIESATRSIQRAVAWRSRRRAPLRAVVGG